jgi:hypothetical protein
MFFEDKILQAIGTDSAYREELEKVTVESGKIMVKISKVSDNIKTITQEHSYNGRPNGQIVTELKKIQSTLEQLLKGYNVGIPDTKKLNDIVTERSDIINKNRKNNKHKTEPVPSDFLTDIKILEELLKEIEGMKKYIAKIRHAKYEYLFKKLLPCLVIILAISGLSITFLNERRQESNGSGQPEQVKK